jgi:hypothetical protein
LREPPLESPAALALGETWRAVTLPLLCVVVAPIGLHIGR